MFPVRSTFMKCSSPPLMPFDDIQAKLTFPCGPVSNDGQIENWESKVSLMSWDQLGDDDGIARLSWGDSPYVATSPMERGFDRNIAEVRKTQTRTNAVISLICTHQSILKFPPSNETSSYSIEPEDYKTSLISGYYPLSFLKTSPIFAAATSTPSGPTLRTWTK